MVVMIFGVWLSTRHDACGKSLTIPMLSIEAVIFLIFIVGFLGTMKRSSILLWVYLVMLFFILVGILVFTVLVFIVTNNGSGHSVTGLSSWFLKEGLGSYRDTVFLLYGPPSCGRTQIAKTVTSEAGANFIYIKVMM
ncbi:unnamed protein product [Trifolium pratense]|uniref:Uncharacterized protein n=1 Tax=Trifolium pratense TaxID=57577 RepID=A0ACB0JDY8_TRIPR|nr:unnamed protein product [Trifolium pratense]